MAITSTDLQNIITTTLDYDFYINLANSLLLEYPCIIAYSQDTQDNIALYLSAHLIAISDTQFQKKREKIDTAEDEYVTTSDLGNFSSWGALGTTRFGIALKMFDSNNCLSDLGMNKTNITFENI